MMIAEAERLKNTLTDKYVVVNQSVPELRRFVGLTGKVKTVNMNCRALVEFDGPVDISWYDIDPSFLTVVDAPQPKAKKAEKAKPKAAPAKATAADTSGKKLSPLELARQQGAGGKAAAPASKPEKKLSPLEMARQQGAAGKSATAPKAEAPQTKAPAAAAKLSPLELARQQGAAKAAAETKAAPDLEPVAEEAVVEAPVEEAAPAESQASSGSAAGNSAATPDTTDGIIALARQQGPFTG